jgi:hypothetical protein
VSQLQQVLGVLDILSYSPEQRAALSVLGIGHFSTMLIQWPYLPGMSCIWSTWRGFRR